MCVVQPLNVKIIRSFPGQDFLFSMRLAIPSQGQPSALRLFHCTSIVRTIVAIPARWDDKTGNSKQANNGVYEGCDKWIVVEQKTLWNNCLQNQMRDRINEV